MWTAGIQMKWICDHHSESQFKQLRNSPEKKKVFGGFSGIRTRGLCVRAAVLCQLSNEESYTGFESRWSSITQLLKLRFTAKVTYSFISKYKLHPTCLLINLWCANLKGAVTKFAKADNWSKQGTFSYKQGPNRIGIAANLRCNKSYT